MELGKIILHFFQTIFFWDLIMGLSVTERYQWKKNVTEEYPKVRPVIKEGFRGRLHVDKDKCISCMMCKRACPTGVIEIVKNPDKEVKQPMEFTIDFLKCSFCGFCVEVCPTKAIFHSTEFEMAVYDKNELIQNLDSLGKNLDIRVYKK